MRDIDPEQGETLDSEGRRPKRGANRPNENERNGCCDFHETISKWMLPEDTREVYLEKANCCPPPIFIILISIAEVSFVAHFGGIVAGMTIGYVFFSDYNEKLLKDPRFWICIVGFIVFLIFAVFFNIFISPAS
ncbi:hypothetical protein XENOCAPTIV_012885 [Xenoophorus captivus]|uniref:rhomboid protease n=1 Tax=Xenoophorus captivus TaxID=1517983 RepID=A0ABV0RYH3_9TELE